MQIYQKAEQQLVNEVAWMPIEQVTTVYLLKPYVIGMIENQQGLISSRRLGKHLYRAALRTNFKMLTWLIVV